ncbi:MAG: hypothetical protein GXY91_11175 [Clostridia bacterium]|nr:hypothetical protein [Clostridia bacterium]
MKLQEIVKNLGLEVLVKSNTFDQQIVEGVYVCDLLSNVMAHGRENDLWITIQTHQNILAVASLLNFSAILLPENLNPDRETLMKAEKENIILLKSSQTAFTLAGQLYELGLRGERG